MDTKKLLLAAVLTFNFQFLAFDCFAQANQSGAGNCLQFNGNNQTVDIGQLGGITNSNSSVFSIDLWLYLDNTIGWEGIVTKWYGAPSSGIFSWGIFKNNNTLQFRLNNSQIIESTVISPIINPNEWYHVAVTYNGTNGQLFLNGNLIGTNNNPGGTINNTPNIGIGSYPRNYCFSCGGGFFTLDGKLDEVRIWNKALTQNEIRDNMCKKLIGNEAGLVGYYRFDETAGNTAFDSSPNGNNGTGF